MAELNFPNYRMLPGLVRQDNATLLKWNAVDLTVDWPRDFLTGNKLPMPTLNLDRTSITEMNVKVNQSIKYKTEPVGRDAWQSPKETLKLGTGDCEDYAILKYGILRVSGMADENLRIVIGEIKDILVNRPHAWLATLLEGHWFSLDCIFDHLTPAESYINWQPKYALSRSTAVQYGPVFRMSDVLPQEGNLS